jgi:hypothetical protein
MQPEDNDESISREVSALVEETVPTPGELARRREIVNRMREIRSRQPESGGPFPSTEQMQREDRDR